MQTLVISALMDAKTEKDLEHASDLAEGAVAAGAMTQEEVEALWDDFEPSLYN
jgi:hypothetical protein